MDYYVYRENNRYNSFYDFVEVSKIVEANVISVYYFADYEVRNTIKKSDEYSIHRKEQIIRLKAKMTNGKLMLDEQF